MLEKQKQQMIQLATKLLAETEVRNPLLSCDLLFPGGEQGSWLNNHDFITAQQLITPHFLMCWLKGLTGCSLDFVLK